MLEFRYNMLEFRVSGGGFLRAAQVADYAVGLKTLLCGGKPQGDMGKPSLICTQNWEIMMKVLNIHQKKCDLTGFINSETDPSPHCFMFLPTWAG